MTSRPARTGRPGRFQVLARAVRRVPASRVSGGDAVLVRTALGHRPGQQVQQFAQFLRSATTTGTNWREGTESFSWLDRNGDGWLSHGDDGRLSRGEVVAVGPRWELLVREAR